jgi:hypothetical protein
LRARQARANVARVLPLAVLLLLAAAGLAALRLPRADRIGRGGAGAFVSEDLAFYLLGVLLGPVLHVLTSGTLLVLVPVLAIALGWIGARVGLGLAAALPATSARATVSLRSVAGPIGMLLAPAAALWVLARAVAPIAGTLTPTLPTALTLAAALAMAMAAPPNAGSQWSAESVPVISWLLATVAATAAVAMLPPVVASRLGAARWPILAALIVLVAGTLAVTLARRSASPRLLLLVTLALGSGAGLAMGVSPFVAGAVGAVLLAAFLPSPAAVEWRLALGVRPIGAALWVIAGAAAAIPRAWHLVPAAVVTVVALLAGWVGRLRVETQEPGGASAIGLAIVVNYGLTLELRETNGGSAFALITTASLALLASQILGRLTGSVAQAEVSA